MNREVIIAISVLIVSTIILLGFVWCACKIGAMNDFNDEREKDDEGTDDNI